MVTDVLENKDAIIEKLVASGISRDEVAAKIRDKQEEYGGLLTDAGAAYAIAKELRIDVGFEPKRMPMKISDIKPGIEGVDIDGEVSQVFPAKAWEKDGRKGRVGSVIIRDASGEIRLTLWNTECDLIENGELKRGARVRITNAAVRERNGMAELGLSHGGNIAVTEATVPKVVKLADVTEGMNDVTFAARVDRIYPVTEFERKDGRGRVASMTVSDGTERRLALWDENADKAGQFAEGDVILVEGAYVKVNRGKPELHVGRRGRIVRNPAGITFTNSTRRCAVSEMRGGEQCELRATVVRVYAPTVYDVCSKCGKKHDGECCGPAKQAMVVNAELDDGTGVVRAVFFRSLAEKLLGFSAEEYAKDASVFNETMQAGNEMVFTGTARHNDMYGRDEFVVKAFHGVDVGQEIRMLKGE